ncbi:hypothetical protein WT72_05025 [Burkholderia pseudomultivorans]|nr:hypothetical protein WT72_05025 [Burkholderia pseudomultivorans]
MSGFMLPDVLSEPHRLHLEFLRVLPSRYHVLCHALLYTDKKLSNFLLMGIGVGSIVMAENQMHTGRFGVWKAQRLNRLDRQIDWTEKANTM